jgi:hypothetical protein
MSMAHSFRRPAACIAVMGAALLGCRDQPESAEPLPNPAASDRSRATATIDPVASRHAPSGLYRLVIEPVSDTCDPPRTTGAVSPNDGMSNAMPAASTWALPGGQHGAHGWMLNIPLVTMRPPAGAAPSGLARMDLLIAPGPPRTSTRPLAIGCDASVTDTYEFDGYTRDGFRIRHIETWPELSGCAAKPPASPAAACRSERLMAFQLVEACPPDCSIRPDLSHAGGPKASCQCRGGTNSTPTPR